MTAEELNQNFQNIIQALEKQGLKRTNIALSIGYTTTVQLNNALSGEGLLSTKAVIALLGNLNVNPMYLFLGKGEMFLTEEDEVDRLKKESQEWMDKFHECERKNGDMKELMQKLDSRISSLIDLSSSALEAEHQKLTIKMIDYIRENYLPEMDERQEVEMYIKLGKFLRNNKSK